MKDDIVIVGAARTPAAHHQCAFAISPARSSAKSRSRRALGARWSRAAPGVSESDHGADSHDGEGRTGPQGVDRSGNSVEVPGLGE